MFHFKLGFALVLDHSLIHIVNPMACIKVTVQVSGYNDS